MEAESLHRLEAPADAERARSRVEEADAKHSSARRLQMGCATPSMDRQTRRYWKPRFRCILSLGKGSTSPIPNGFLVETTPRFVGSDVRSARPGRNLSFQSTRSRKVSGTESSMGTRRVCWFPTQGVEECQFSMFLGERKCMNI